MNPAVRPVDWESLTAMRMAKGDAVPIRIIGTQSKIITVVNEPSKTPSWSSSNAFAARRRRGLETSGTSAVLSAAQMRIVKNVRYFGDLSAHGPPIKYPTAR